MDGLAGLTTEVCTTVGCFGIDVKTVCALGRESTVLLRVRLAVRWSGLTLYVVVVMGT